MSKVRLSFGNIVFRFPSKKVRNKRMRGIKRSLGI